MPVKRFESYGQYEDGFKVNAQKVIAGFYNQDQANLDPQYAEHNKHPSIGNANGRFVKLHDCRLLENHDPTRDWGLACFEKGDQIL